MSNTGQIFNDAIFAINNRDLKRAEELFRSVIKADESHIGALNLLAVVLMSTERFAEAEPFIARATSLNQRSDVSFYNYGLISKRLRKPQQAFENFSKAIALNPHVPETWNNRGTVLNDLNKYDLAISDFDRAIAINGQYSEAYANKGKSLSSLKRNDEALAAYDKALSLKPDLAEAWLGRGNAFMDLERHDDALAAYDRALSLKPNLEGAWLRRGDALWNQRRYHDAFAAYDKALSLKPDLAEARLGQGHALYRLRRLDEALAAYDRAVAQRPDFAEAWLGRGNVFYNSNRHDEALAAYDKAIAQKPDLAEAWHKRGVIKVILGNEREGQRDCEQAVLLGASKEAVDFNLARHGAIKNVPIVPRKLVEDIFDDHAAYFDSHLVEELEYLVPSKLFDLILQHAEKNTLVDVLDLGCGTGLMAVPLRPIVKTLVGVDLSRRMLEKAKVRAIYDELACRDIVEFTKSDTRTYDLVTSTDVFIYVGELSAVFDAVYRSLNVGGYFAFSVEATDEGNYILTESGRYRHSKEYLERLAHDNGFKILAIEDCILRKEGQREMPGFLAVMFRPR